MNSMKESDDSNLPIGFHKESKEMIMRRDVIDQPDILQPINELDKSQQTKLIIARWKAGQWVDMIYNDELITAERALKEVQENTELGQELVRISFMGYQIKLEGLMQSNK
ncbi:MAG: hypothetical protein V7L29_33125 [Nostoc sp.]|uniref:hypothetical protein n=1 Tax=Nostoc sp. TaxID=1180 RepID=UPI002FFABF58